MNKLVFSIFVCLFIITNTNSFSQHDSILKKTASEMSAERLSSELNQLKTKATRDSLNNILGSIEDSLLNIENHGRQKQLEIDRLNETRKHQEEILKEEQKKQRKQEMLIYLIATLVILFIAIIYGLYRRIKKLKSLLTEEQLKQIKD